jgi:hypothetical protein
MADTVPVPPPSTPVESAPIADIQARRLREERIQTFEAYSAWVLTESVEARRSL